VLDEPAGRSARWCPPHGADPAVTRAARGWARRVLPVLLGRPVGAALQDDLDLLLSELCANAVRHAAGVEEIRLFCTATALRVTVRDTGPGRPIVRYGVGTDSDNGRGMLLVEAIAARWGVQLGPGGKDVWLELPTV
jgi:anti-sigma regulatory factor (Ser/Thr protein kinase)